MPLPIYAELCITVVVCSALYILWFLWLHAWLIFLSAHHRKTPEIYSTIDFRFFSFFLSAIHSLLTVLLSESTSVETGVVLGFVSHLLLRIPIDIQYFKIEISFGF